MFKTLRSRTVAMAAVAAMFAAPLAADPAHPQTLSAEQSDGVSSDARVSVIQSMEAATMSYVPQGSTGAYSLMTANGVPKRWNPCKPIRYRVNARADKRRGTIKNTKAAFRKLGRATGMNFVFKGRTRHVPDFQGSKMPTGTDIVVAWAPKSNPWFRDRPGVVGLGGSSYISGRVDRKGNDVYEAVNGSVLLNASIRLKNGYRDSLSRGALLLHEIAHVIGLEHVNEYEQIMYPSMRRDQGRARYNAGDLAGLEKLGASQGCIRVKYQRSYSSQILADVDEYFYPASLAGSGRTAYVDGRRII